MGDLDRASINIFERQRTDAGGTYPYWSLPLRGEFKRLYPETRDDYEVVMKDKMSPRGMEGSRNFMIKCCDLVDLHTDWTKVATFVEALKQLQAVADHVALIELPHTEYFFRSAEGVVRAKAVADRIERETGLHVMGELADKRFTHADFYDAQHLNEVGGRTKYSRILAEDLADQLKKDPR
jgi:hypothetical protein